VSASRQLVAIAILAAIGVLWMFVNLRTNRASNLKTVSLWLMWTFLLMATAAAVRVAWGLL
jgi:hypothetical protein